jgi:hypothetical protein
VKREVRKRKKGERWSKSETRGRLGKGRKEKDGMKVREEGR